MTKMSSRLAQRPPKPQQGSYNANVLNIPGTMNDNTNTIDSPINNNNNNASRGGHDNSGSSSFGNGLGGVGTNHLNYHNHNLTNTVNRRSSGGNQQCFHNDNLPIHLGTTGVSVGAGMGGGPPTTTTANFSSTNRYVGGCHDYSTAFQPSAASVMYNNLHHPHTAAAAAAAAHAYSLTTNASGYSHHRPDDGTNTPASLSIQQHMGTPYDTYNTNTNTAGDAADVAAAMTYAVTANVTTNNVYDSQQSAAYQTQTSASTANVPTAAGTEYMGLELQQIQPRRGEASRGGAFRHSLLNAAAVDHLRPSQSGSGQDHALDMEDTTELHHPHSHGHEHQNNHPRSHSTRHGPSHLYPSHYGNYTYHHHGSHDYSQQPHDHEQEQGHAYGTTQQQVQHSDSECREHNTHNVEGDHEMVERRLKKTLCSDAAIQRKKMKESASPSRKNPQTSTFSTSTRSDATDATVKKSRKRRTISLAQKELAEQAWQAKYQQLVDFYKENGHSDVPQLYSLNRALGKWVGKQREHYKTFCFHKEKESQDNDNSDFADKTSDLSGGRKKKNTKKEIKNPTPPSQASRTCPMTQERIDKLKSLDFKFNIGKGQFAKVHGIFSNCQELLEAWEEKFQLLLEFKEKFGHCDVPLRGECPVRMIPLTATNVADTARGCTNGDDTTESSNFNISNGSKKKNEQEEKNVDNEDRVDYDAATTTAATSDAATAQDINTPVIVDGSLYHESTVVNSSTDNDEMEATYGDSDKEGDNKKEDKNVYEVACENNNKHGNIDKHETNELEKYRSLGRWIAAQRRKYKSVKINETIKSSKVLEDRFKRLADIGFRFIVGKGDYLHRPHHSNNPIINNAIEATRERQRENNMKRYKGLWDMRYEELCEYKRLNGHCNVPQTYKENAPLARWVATQRELWRRGRRQSKNLSKKSRCVKATTIETSTDLNGVDSKKVSYHVDNVNDSIIDEKMISCSMWPLSQERKEKLLQLGFEFDIANKGFEHHVDLLRRYKEENGHLDVKCSGNEKHLYCWMQRQRILFREFLEGKRASSVTKLIDGKTPHGIVDNVKSSKNVCFASGKMTHERISMLEEIGFDWQYKFETIDREVVKAATVNAGILEKLKKQKRRGPKVHKKGKDFIKHDEKLGIDGNDNFHNEDNNEVGIPVLETEQKEVANDGGNAGTGEASDYDDGGISVENTLIRNQDGELVIPISGNDKNAKEKNLTSVKENSYMTSDEKSDKLCRIGDKKILEGDENLGNNKDNCEIRFQCESIETTIPGKEADTTPLILEDSEHPQINIKKSAEGDAALQKIRHKKGTKPILWQNTYNDLVAFQREFGHCRVPAKYHLNPRLGYWVKLQREDYRHMKEKKPSPMNEYRIKQLEKIGFEWRILPINNKISAWNVKFEELLAFKKEFGHCDVPQAYKKNVSLGKWVSKQREFYRFMNEGKPTRLTPERIQKLENVGFRFFVGKGRALRTWDQFFDDLLSFKTQYGHTNIPLGHEDDPQLGRWAYQQRVNLANKVSRKNQNSITSQRLHRLQEIGFGFHVSEGELDSNGKLLKRKKVGNDEHGGSDDKSNEDTVVKSKKRGRPRKLSNLEEKVCVSMCDEEGKKLKRKRGRPKKLVKPDVESGYKRIYSTGPEIKRRPGRPRKVTISDEKSDTCGIYAGKKEKKQKRGRPKKLGKIDKASSNSDSNGDKKLKRKRGRQKKIEKIDMKNIIDQEEIGENAESITIEPESKRRKGHQSNNQKFERKSSNDCQAIGKEICNETDTVLESELEQVRPRKVEKVGIDIRGDLIDNSKEAVTNFRDEGNKTRQGKQNGKKNLAND